MSDAPKNEVPVACTLRGSELAERRGELLPGLGAEALECRELAEEGYALRFGYSAGRLAQIVDVIARERECCRFFRFRLTAEPDAGPLWLEVTGPAGTRELLRSIGVGPIPPHARGVI